MQKEKGLKRIYRFISIGCSYVLFKISKKINPNTITILGFITFMIGWIQYLTIFILGEIVFLNKIFFVVAIHSALIIDYTDGDYAGRINRRSKVGHYLDGVLDFSKILLTYFLGYFTTDHQFEKLLLFLSLIVLAFFLWSKSNIYRENITKKPSKEGKFLTVSLLFGFSLVHQYLYFSIYILFGLWQILLLQILLGLALTLKNFITVIKYAKKIDTDIIQDKSLI